MKEDTKAVVNNDELDPGTAANTENENQAAANTENVSQEPDKGKKTKKAEAPKPANLYDKETYDITLPIKEGEDDEVTVLINGECTKIQRGVQVTVSAAVYEVLQNSMKMDNLAYQRSKKLSEFKQLN